MALNKAIMLLLEMRESSMMPTVFKVYINDIIKTVSQCEEPSAQPETNRSVFPNNSDTISRQAAIDKITKRLFETAFNNVGIKQDIDETLVDVAENRLENWFNELQPVQRWVPCSERLPEEREWIGTKRFGTTISDEVYVTFEAPDGQRFTDHISFQNGKLSASDAERMRVWYKGAKPVAWMPLPEPYHGGKR